MCLRHEMINRLCHFISTFADRYSVYHMQQQNFFASLIDAWKRSLGELVFILGELNWSCRLTTENTFCYCRLITSTPFFILLNAISIFQSLLKAIDRNCNVLLLVAISMSCALNHFVVFIFQHSFCWKILLWLLRSTSKWPLKNNLLHIRITAQSPEKNSFWPHKSHHFHLPNKW